MQVVDKKHNYQLESRAAETPLFKGDWGSSSLVMPWTGCKLKTKKSHYLCWQWLPFTDYISIYDYSGTSLLRTFWDPEFLAVLCCNIASFRGKNVLTRPVGTKIFVLAMEVFSIMSLIRGVC